MRSIKRCISALSVCLLAACHSAAGYEYTEPMDCFDVYPLGYPRMPFVLRFSKQELLNQDVWTSEVDAILIESGTASAVRIGAQALKERLTKLRNKAVAVIELDPGASELPQAVAEGGRCILMGVPRRFSFLQALVSESGLAVNDGALNGDGFVIKPISRGKLQFLVITSAVDRGVLYGAYELEERTTSRGVPRIDQSFVPAVRYRSWPVHSSANEPYDSAGRLRLNLSVLFDYWQPASLFYPDFPELGGAAKTESVRRRQRTMHEKFADAAKYGSIPTVVFNPFGFNSAPAKDRQALGKAHPGMLAKPWPGINSAQHGEGRWNLCPSSPDTRKYVESGVRELVRTFPEIQMLILQYSDMGGELLCGCEKCARYPFVDRVVDYTRLMIKTARSANPHIRFMMRIHALNSFLPAHHPEFARDPSAGFKEITTRLGKDIEAVEMRPTTPPGGDFQSWLSPESTMLGQGIPIYFFFHYYEANGPGTVAPLSPIISHLSWDLPVYLEKLNQFIKPGAGMIGGTCDTAGQETAYWHPDLDPCKYIQNWCRAKYGDTAGPYIAEALKDTHKITEAFHPETKRTCAESFDLYRWGAPGRAWAVDMSNASFQDDPGKLATGAFHYPIAPQPEDLLNVTLKNKDERLERFSLRQETAIAERAEAMTEMAVAASPGDKEVRRLFDVARQTKALARLYREYHLALVYANLARNCGDRQWVERGRGHLKNAIEQVVEYRDASLPLGQWKNEAIRLNALSGYTKNLYVPGALCTVREAAYLFGSEFGGEDMLKFFDDRSGWKSAGLGSLRRVLTVAATSPSAYRRSAEGIPLNRRGSLTERPVAPPVNPMLSLR